MEGCKILWEPVAANLLICPDSKKLDRATMISSGHDSARHSSLFLLGNPHHPRGSPPAPACTLVASCLIYLVPQWDQMMSPNWTKTSQEIDGIRQNDWQLITQNCSIEESQFCGSKVVLLVLPFLNPTQMKQTRAKLNERGCWVQDSAGFHEDPGGEGEFAIANGHVDPAESVVRVYPIPLLNTMNGP